MVEKAFSVPLGLMDVRICSGCIVRITYKYGESFKATAPRISAAECGSWLAMRWLTAWSYRPAASVCCQTEAVYQICGATGL